MISSKPYGFRHAGGPGAKPDNATQSEQHSCMAVIVERTAHWPLQELNNRAAAHHKRTHGEPQAAVCQCVCLTLLWELQFNLIAAVRPTWYDW